MSVGKTYFIDLDGTIVPYKTNVQLENDVKNINVNDYSEQLLPGVRELWGSFDDGDVIILTTARKANHRGHTLKMLQEHSLRFNQLIMDLPNGPRVLINDTPSVLEQKAIAINVYRNAGFPDFGDTIDSPNRHQVNKKKII
jgi:hypothetical protein